MVPIVTRVASGTPTSEKRVVAAYALRFIGAMRVKRQLGNEVALDRLRAFAAGCTSADAALVQDQPPPTKRQPRQQRKKQSSARSAKKEYMRKLERDVSGGAPGLGRKG